MEELLPRFRLARAVFNKELTLGQINLDVELVFLQFRKILEQIAFASLVANKDAYSAARKNFATDWRAPKILKYLEAVNPHFYPEPLKIASQSSEGGRRRLNLQRLSDGF